MSDVEKASREAVKAAEQGEQFALILAAITAAQAAQQPVHHPVPLPAPQQPSQAGKWLAIGVGGSVLLLTVAISAVAVAVAAVSVALSSLVIYAIYRDIFGKKSR